MISATITSCEFEVVKEMETELAELAVAMIAFPSTLREVETIDVVDLANVAEVVVVGEVVRVVEVMVDEEVFEEGEVVLVLEEVG